MFLWDLTAEISGLKPSCLLEFFHELFRIIPAALPNPKPTLSLEWDLTINICKYPMWSWYIGRVENPFAGSHLRRQLADALQTTQVVAHLLCEQKRPELRSTAPVCNRGPVPQCKSMIPVLGRQNPEAHWQLTYPPNVQCSVRHCPKRWWSRECLKRPQHYWLLASTCTHIYVNSDRHIHTPIHLIDHMVWKLPLHIYSQQIAVEENKVVSFIVLLIKIMSQILG